MLSPTRHVIRSTENITVKFLNGEKINAEALLKDSQNDIGFLKLERSPQLPRPISNGILLSIFQQ